MPWKRFDQKMDTIKEKCLERAYGNLTLLEYLFYRHEEFLDMSTDPTTDLEQIPRMIDEDIYEMEDPYSELPLAKTAKTELQKIGSNFRVAPYGGPLEEGYKELIWDIFIPMMLEEFASCQCPKPVKPLIRK